MLISHSCDDGRHQSKAVIAADSVVPRQTVSDTEFQVGKNIQFLYKILFTYTPCCRYSRKVSPFIILSEFRRPIRTESCGKQVLIRKVIIETSKEREQIIIIVFIGRSNGRSTQTHISQNELIGRQPTDTGFEHTSPAFYKFLSQLYHYFMFFLKTFVISQDVRGLKTSGLCISDRAVNTVASSHYRLVAIKKLPAIKLITHTRIVAEGQSFDDFESQSAIGLQSACFLIILFFSGGNQWILHHVSIRIA